jgi:kynurenine formamidase
MKTTLINALIPLILLSGTIACTRRVNHEVSHPFENVTWIDLTYPFDSTTLYWPNNSNSFKHSVDFKGVVPMGYFYSSYSLSMPEHGGTHLDAPVHFAEGRESTDAVPLTSLTGEAVVIDVSKDALLNRDYRIGSSEIQQWEKENATTIDHKIVLFRTGYGQFYPNREAYFGTSLRGAEAIPQLHFPGIASEAADWIVKNRKVKAVGLDTPSLDYGQSTDFLTHRILMESNIPGFENVANLDSLPALGAYVVALPMKVAQGSGAPLRIIACIHAMN